MKMIREVFVAVCAVIAINLYAVPIVPLPRSSFGTPVYFNRGWTFQGGATYLRATPVDLPHDWSIEAAPDKRYASCQGYLPGGKGVYRKVFLDTDFPKADSAFIYFEGVYNRSEVRLNGKLLGRRPNGYASFLYNMTPYLKKGKNTIEVRVDHSRQADSRWYTGSGIYRDVWVLMTGKTHFGLWSTNYKLERIEDDGTAVVSVQYDVVGPTDGCEVEVSVWRRDKMVAKASVTPPQPSPQGEGGVLLPLGDGGKGDLKSPSPCGEGRGGVELRIPKAQLWDIDAPNLYDISFRLKKDGKMIDISSVKAGLRTLSFDANSGFCLNGRNIKVKGVCLHHDAGVLGAVVPYEVWLRRVQELKKMGCNAIRMSHNPQSPVLYDVCDELGMLVMDEASDEWEFPKRKWVEGWNKGEPAYEGTFDFFEEWIDRDVADMVRRDRHHACIFLWSIGNEVDYPNDPYSHPVLDGGNAAINQPMFGGYKKDAPNAERIGKIAKRLAAVVKSIDTTRPTTGALAGVVMSNQTEYPEAVDVVGYNYTENRYLEDHATYPDRIIYGSETGVGYDSWLAVRDNPHIFGQFVWTGTDYLGESGAWPSRGLGTGLLDFASFRKARGWMRAAMWSSEPVIYAGTMPSRFGRRGGRGNRGAFVSADAPDYWNYKEGDTIRVMCYTNQPVVRLLLNGRPLGTKARDDRQGITWFDVPFAPGTLTAEGCAADGTVRTAYSVHTTGAPTQLRITCIDPCKCPGPEFTHQVLIEVLDAEGHLVHRPEAGLHVDVAGAATLIGLENGDNSDMSQHRAPDARVTTGRVVAYIRRNALGEITLKASLGAQGVPDATIRL